MFSITILMLGLRIASYISTMASVILLYDAIITIGDEVGVIKTLNYALGNPLLTCL